MGAGLALQFREKYFLNYAAYRTACKKRQVKIGVLFTTENKIEPGPKWIVNFPTKVHWKDGSRLEYIVLGLKALEHFINDKGIRSVAIPRIGAGCGRLEWSRVRQEIVARFSGLEHVNIFIYE